MANTSQKVSLSELGFNTTLDNYRTQENLVSFEVGRVISEHKERYTVKTEDGDFEAEIMGNLRFTAQSRLDFPAVGDWVAVSAYDEGKLLIHHIYKRSAMLKRKAVGKHGELQLIATNIDYGFIVQSVNRDFSLNRIERYLTICYEAKVKPIVVLTKVDLLPSGELEVILADVQDRIFDVPLVAVSNETGEGISELKEYLYSGQTYCLLGSSGVGKSSLINTLSGSQQMKTGVIGQGTNRGKHVTTSRELIVLEGGGVLIDNPGMREVGMADVSEGLEHTFEMITELSASCRYGDCTHVHEKGCAVLEAVENGELSVEVYENYQKLQREKQHFESTVAEKRRKGKDLARMVKEAKRVKNR